MTPVIGSNQAGPVVRVCGRRDLGGVLGMSETLRLTAKSGAVRCTQSAGRSRVRAGPADGAGGIAVANAYTQANPTAREPSP